MTKHKWPTPRRGSIVLCKFPHTETPNSPGPYARPAIVVDVSSAGDMVKVCYGTGQAHHASAETLSLFEFGVFEEKHLRALSLDEVTIFDLSRVVTLPYDDIWFEVPKARTSSNPIISGFEKCKVLKPKLFRAMYMAGLSALVPPQLHQEIADEIASAETRETGT